jgi:hypothetical protein
MKRLILTAIAAVALLILALPASAQQKTGAAELPISRIVLFSSGVGYFQRDGQVEGTAHVDLQFPANDVNDLLKSLVLQDMGGGQVSTVSYDNRNPIEMTLKSFALDLTQNPSLGDLLNQARGERVELIAAPANKPPETVAGVIVGVETQRQPVGREQVIEVRQLNLLTGEGLRGIPLAQVQRVRFSREELDREFHKALEVLATSHDKQKKTVSLSFAGQGRRPVRVGYVTASPMWKTSYRLEVQKDKLFLQGWAIVENTTDQDWNNVRLGLVSGRPISFKMDLYEPLFVPRPVVEPELFASLRPPNYSGNLDRADDVPLKRNSFGAPIPPAAGAAPVFAGQRKAGEVLHGLNEAKDEEKQGSLQFSGLANAATASELGEYFQYAIKDPVSLARQKSALLPIVNQEVAGTKVSIYNQNVHVKFPLLGLRFKNNTPLHLSQGPVTVFENSAYAGDARIPDLQPNETRLLSYAIDLGTEVEPKTKSTDMLVSARIWKGTLYATYRLRETQTYTIKNRSETARTVIIEHPYRSQYKLVAPEKPAERSRDVYRFEVAAEPGKPASLEVVEELPRVQQVVLTNADDDAVRFFIRSTAVSDRVKKALQHALELKERVNVTMRQIEREEKALKVISDDQARMRANMQRVPPTSEAYKRYLKKFDEQETEIERRQTQVAKLQQTADQDRKTYEDYLATLEVE